MIARFKGQSEAVMRTPVCHGTLTITLSGPAGCGKSLVFKILRALLPLTGVAAVILRTRTSK